jgi:hypothetical protein
VCGHEIRILVCLVEGVLSRLVICIIICRRFDNAKGVLLRLIRVHVRGIL